MKAHRPVGELAAISALVCTTYIGEHPMDVGRLALGRDRQGFPCLLDAAAAGLCGQLRGVLPEGTNRGARAPSRLLQKASLSRSPRASPLRDDLIGPVRPSDGCRPTTLAKMSSMVTRAPGRALCVPRCATFRARPGSRWEGPWLRRSASRRCE